MAKKNFIARDGKTYVIDIDDDGCAITVLLNGKECGSMGLTLVDDGHKHCSNYYYYIVDLSLENCKRKGIGEACLRFHQRTFELPITAANHDGNKREDGSHLVNDGPGFVARMKEKGIIV